MTVTEQAKTFKRYLVDYEYLICSEAFVNKPYYIISANEDNHLHLTGVGTRLSASEFFDKCYEGTLVEDDFDLAKSGKSLKDAKGSIRRKINMLSEIDGIFSVYTQVEEGFYKNKISCSFAMQNNTCTLGFTGGDKSRPKTLLKGNELNVNKAKRIDLVFQRKGKTGHFTELISGSVESLEKYKSILHNIISEDVYIKE